MVATQHNVGDRLPQQSTRALIYLALTIGAAIAAFPFAYMILTSLMTYQETAQRTLIPHIPQWQNYLIAWSQAPFGRYFINSTIVAVSTFLGLLVTSTLAG